MSATVKDIAKKSGLSVATVIHIMGDHGHRYRPETREKVMAVARKLGYRPNASARAMRRGCFDSVSLLMSSVSNRNLLNVAALEGICDALNAHNMHLSVARLPDESLSDESYVPKLLREWSADGLLISFAVEIPQRMIQLIENYKLPCVWMRLKRESDCIYPDEEDAGRQATEHFIRSGHRRIAYVDYSVGNDDPRRHHYGVVDCEVGYRAAMKAAGLPPRVVRGNDIVPRTERSDYFRKLLSTPDRPTAILGHYASTAWPAVYAAAQMGLRIPEDLALMTLSATPENALGIALTTMVIPEYELGRQAADMLIRKIREPKKTIPPLALKFQLVQGTSTLSV